MHQLELFPELVRGQAHSKIGASSMSRWSKCPGSVRLCETVPAEPSKYAEEGNRAHAMASDILERKPVVVDDPAMFAAVAVYLEYVWKISRRGKLFIEHRFDLSSLHAGLFGTADAVVYLESTKHLVVADYKHGSGVPVEVRDNPQLKYYALGALLTLPVVVETVELVIVQPRRAHPDGVVRAFTLSSFELLEFSADLISFAKATEAPDAPLVPGSHCRFCPAKTVCPEYPRAQAEAKLEQAREVFSPVPHGTA